MPAASLPTIPAAPVRTSRSAFPAAHDTMAASLVAMMAGLNTRQTYLEALPGTETPAWVSGASYTAGDDFYSPITLKNFRCILTHSGETSDPSIDPTRWKMASGLSGTDQAKLDLATVTKPVNLDLAGKFQAVANGAIGAGKVVVLEDAGTVKEAELSGVPTSSIASTSQMFTAKGFDIGAVMFGTDMLLFHNQASTSSYTCLVKHVSLAGDVIGTTNVETAPGKQTYDAYWEGDRTNGVLGVFENYSGQDIEAIYGEWSGSAMSWGASVTLQNFVSTSDRGYILSAHRGIYNATYDRWLAFWGHYHGTDNYDAMIAVGSVSGLNVTFGTAVEAMTAFSSRPLAVQDTSRDDVYMFSADGSSSGKTNQIHFNKGAISATTVVFDGPVAFGDTGLGYVNLYGAEYHPDLDAIILVYHANSNASVATSLYLCLIDLSSGSPVAGTPVPLGDLHASLASWGGTVKAVPGTDDFLLLITDGTTQYGTLLTIRIAAGAITSPNTPIVLHSQNAQNRSIDRISDTRFAVVTANGNSTTENSVDIIQPDSTATDAGGWVGIVDDAVADGETATVILPGGKSVQQSGLSIRSTYYVDDDGSLTTVSTGGRKIGKAIAADKLKITEGNAA